MMMAVVVVMVVVDRKETDGEKVLVLLSVPKIVLFYAESSLVNILYIHTLFLPGVASSSSIS
jgi:hypothetical protein